MKECDWEGEDCSWRCSKNINDLIQKQAVDIFASELKWFSEMDLMCITNSNGTKGMITCSEGFSSHHWHHPCTAVTKRRITQFLNCLAGTRFTAWCEEKEGVFGQTNGSNAEIGRTKRNHAIHKGSILAFSHLWMPAHHSLTSSLTKPRCLKKN